MKNEQDKNYQKTIFITGGANGLGRAIAIRFAKAGYKIGIGDIDSQQGHIAQEECLSLTDDVFYVNCDVTDMDSITQAKDKIIERWGGIGVVVNNAGVAGTVGKVEEVSTNDWQWVFDINLLGVVKGCQAFLPTLRQQQSGHIVNIASAAGLMNVPLMGSYNVAKAGVISLSETLRVECAPDNIGVSVACPGFFPTQLGKSLRSTIDGMAERVEQLMAKSGVSAEDVADDIYRAVNENRFWILPHKTERNLFRIKRWFPEFFFRQMLKRTKKIFQREKR